MAPRSLLSVALLSAVSGIVAAAPPATQPPHALSWEAGMRLRVEHVDDDLFQRNANATTVRLRGAMRWQPTSTLETFVEAEAVGALGDHYNSTANGQTAYPVVADPQGIELNHAWVRWHHADNGAELGRQRITLDNQRWIGNSGWRQNEQTFDALSLQYAPVESLTLRYSAVGRVHRVNGDNARDPLARERELEAHLLNASWSHGAHRISGYGYLVEDQDVAAASTATWGARYVLAPVPKQRAWGVALEAARQSDYGNNVANFAHTYWLVEPTLSWRGVAFRAGWEHLGGNGSHALQTPLASLHAFNGWADRFLVTPAQGLEDRYLAAGGKALPHRSRGAMEWQAAWHDFSADASSAQYGHELDASLAVPLTPTLKALIKIAAFRADGLSRDVDKSWLQLEWTPAPR